MKWSILPYVIIRLCTFYAYSFLITFGFSDWPIITFEIFLFSVCPRRTKKKTFFLTATESAMNGRKTFEKLCHSYNAYFVEEVVYRLTFKLKSKNSRQVRLWLVLLMFCNFILPMRSPSLSFNKRMIQFELQTFEFLNTCMHSWNQSEKYIERH